MDDIKLPTFTLRSHASKVTALTLIYANAVPNLVSGDEGGKIVKWDLITRRPLVAIDSIEAQIIEIKQLDPDCIAVLSKDYTLRVYDFDLSNVLFETKVNTLNFANFIIYKEPHSDWNTLIVCNTKNSENIDVYKFQLNDFKSLKRIFNNLDFKNTMDYMKNERFPQIEKLGLIMKLLKVGELIYCGFESGVIIAFRFSEDESFIEVVYISVLHCPNPILDFCYDEISDAVLSSSTNETIGKHPIIRPSTGENRPLTLEAFDSADYFVDKEQKILLYKNACISVNGDQLNITFKKIGHLKVLESYLLLSSWSGKTAILDKRTSNLLTSFCKSKSSVLVSESSQGSFDSNSVKQKDTTFSKIGSMTGFDPSFNTMIATDIVSKKQTLGQQRRNYSFLEHCWCFIGYDDGSICAHRL
ncbi:hypothetical protein KAFR_0H00750 [Kazachstania africana CBS 2517]|uniref:ASTRA-associated protein 1 n=1 Tax=Kazachstania africana (strain ATCC 22294 / BCRC 22015 / CBS 2517 / CECT 1963 / NBRC 1671 / NRRL Y-8276) TaxID=1071382 RepID=H2AYS8_KAZAF|nr:hypothetical protein KAFR_0H00750 [Kazachstania africana CBS 2517]CCF59484.1 hypothetical protein KAFR_0H00750 [Kazachstania africana CBS 2517]